MAARTHIEVGEGRLQVRRGSSTNWTIQVEKRTGRRGNLGADEVSVRCRDEGEGLEHGKVGHCLIDEVGSEGLGRQGRGAHRETRLFKIVSP